jgi:stage II sporulation protein D
VVVLDGGGEQAVLETGSATLRFERDGVAVSAGSKLWRASRVEIHARDGGDADFILAIPGKIHRRYRGKLEMGAAADQLTAVVAMDLEVAVASAVAAESPPGASMEALKAQAVASRSFYSSRAAGHAVFDFCDTTHCQFLREPPAEASPAMRATHATRGMVLAYKGTTFAAMFSSSCGGRTKSLAELGLPVRDYPYFAVECPYCQRNPDRWTRTIPQAASGERGRIAYNRQHGWSAIPGNDYSVKQSSAGLIVDGSGLGHGLGLCQRGAAAMAAEGKDFREILAYYFPNTTLRVH